MPIYHVKLTTPLAAYLTTEHEYLTVAAGARLLEHLAPLPELHAYHAAMARCRVVGANEASR